jgi:hypothetical protein
MIQQDLVELGKMPFVSFMPFGALTMLTPFGVKDFPLVAYYISKFHISNDSNDMKDILHTFTRSRGIEK